TAIATWYLTRPNEPKPEPTARVASGEDLARLVGCREYNNTSSVVFVAEGGTCVLDGKAIDISYFASIADRDAFVAVLRDVNGRAVVGPNWAVHAFTPEQLRAVQRRIGGTIEPPFEPGE
ncbi:MAG: hypothetical protein M3467_02555, partial [Actinomycetota bacterium]|nr:hypothetical protein [Actinomycetota bacterium]